MPVTVGQRGMKRDYMFVQSTTEIGGAETVLLNLLSGSAELRDRSVVATLGFGRGDLPSRLRATGAEVLDLRIGRLRNPLGVLTSVLRLAATARRRGIRAVVGNGAHPQVIASLVARASGARAVYMVHTLYSDPARLGRIDRLALRLPCDVLVANSVATAYALGRLRPSVRQEVVYPGVASEEVAPESAGRARSELGIEEGQLLYGVFGRLQRGKGQDVFLDAAARVAPDLPQARFLVVGGTVFGLERDYAPQLQARAARLGLFAKVVFTGQRTDVSALMAACDVVCVTSRDPEAFGMVAIEAMAQSRPVIATRCGGPEETVVDGGTGVLIAPEAPAALADAMVSLGRDPARAGRMGAAGRARMEKHFTKEAMAQRLLTALRKVGPRR